jgi:glycine cleavage system H lipoate-binding protein
MAQRSSPSKKSRDQPAAQEVNPFGATRFHPKWFPSRKMEMLSEGISRPYRDETTGRSRETEYGGKMVSIKKFLGNCVDIPEDRRYDPKRGLWAKVGDREIVFGLSEPALILLGGLNDLDWLATDGAQVEEGGAVIFAITGKILYIDTPVAGIIHFNNGLKQALATAMRDPYGEGWLFKIRSHQDLNQLMDRFSNAEEYVQSLKSSEGYKNPDGLKGGVSGICKAVYSGIRDQKI